MHRYLALFLLLGLTAVGGCVSSSYFEPTPIAKPGNAMVYIYRPEATNPGKKPLTLSYPEVMMDGQSVGFLKYNEYLALEVAPGKREFLVTGLTRDAKWEPKDRKLYFYTFRLEVKTVQQ